MTGTPRARARQQTMADILRIGREHLSTHGAAALSLRAVARDLGVVSSAVYRYVASRDELLTLLVVDGYTELADTVDEALADVAADAHAEQFRVLGHAVRAWALREPARYALLFGSPVPGYHAPAERTTGPGTRVVVRLVRILGDAHAAGTLRIPTTVAVPDTLTADLGRIRAELGTGVPDAVLARGVLVWAALFGAVNFEVFGQYGTDTFTDPGQLFDHHLAVLAETVGLS
ncbi:MULTISPECIES: TetR/AcrR family transcriptional regulator [unclassified Rhodococcus (in: high G+C Gram-positive bacteria)]|uniref:TetR/AcrR family transcriptional regulator n=1 Tax=unclassified Rhodococcus (in: high G+C Gram-positive bacteria) TaxID=192944 RepID=UPI000928C703|nr:TetR/AcrR family transcriptional regulator [Rhodococcus sp. M8]OLL19847.1 TetR family transcriptional regulator [Rhodococcus sp. M8]QPG43688.1 TetR/AcrR family transcriptional regulator [Rhodococcus sp. M8]